MNPFLAKSTTCVDSRPGGDLIFISLCLAKTVRRDSRRGAQSRLGLTAAVDQAMGRRWQAAARTELFIPQRPLHLSTDASKVSLAKVLCSTRPLAAFRHRKNPAKIKPPNNSSKVCFKALLGNAWHSITRFFILQNVKVKFNGQNEAPTATPFRLHGLVIPPITKVCRLHDLHHVALGHHHGFAKDA